MMCSLFFKTHESPTLVRPGHPIHANFGACRARRVDEGPASGSSGGARVWRDRSSSGIDVEVVGSGSSDDGNARQDGPVIEGTSLALFHIGRQSRYGLRGVRVGEAFHPGPRGARESTDDELPLVRDRNVIPRCAWARDVTGSVAVTQVDREAATTPSHLGVPMELSPICGLEAHPSNRRRTARPVE